MFRKKKIAFDISFVKNVIELFYIYTEMFSNLENILKKKLCFDISFQNVFIKMTLENMLKTTKMKINKSKKKKYYTTLPHASFVKF